MFGPLVRTSWPSSVSSKSPLSSISCTRFLAYSPFEFSSCRASSYYSRTAIRSLCSSALFAFSRFTSSSSYFCSYCSFISACVRLLLLPVFKRWAPLPLLATDEIRMSTAWQMTWSGQMELTWDIDWPFEGVSDRCIQLDDELLVLRNLVIALLDTLVDPGLEWVTQQRVSHIHDEWARQSRKVSLIRQILRNLRILFSLFENRFDAQAFILRHVEHLDVFRVDIYRRVETDLVTYTSSFPWRGPWGSRWWRSRPVADRHLRRCTWASTLRSWTWTWQWTRWWWCALCHFTGFAFWLECLIIIELALK